VLIVVAGSGMLGTGLARALSAQGHDVVVVDRTVDTRRLGNEFDGITVTGSPIDEDVLRKARIAEAQVFVAATADDSTNAMASQVAEEIFHVPTVLARISDPDREEFYRSLGLHTVCPTATGIRQILDAIRSGAETPRPTSGGGEAGGWKS
jgi:trk system potassium uptake protein TrkA